MDFHGDCERKINLAENGEQQSILNKEDSLKAQDRHWPMASVLIREQVKGICENPDKEQDEKI